MGKAAANQLLAPINPGKHADHKAEPLPDLLIPRFYEYYIAVKAGETVELSR